MDAQEVLENFNEAAYIGYDDCRGACRVFGSEELEKAREALERYMRRAGLETWVDSADNVHAVYRCGLDNVEEIMVGSHLDSVVEGGKYDGLLGIVAGVEVVRTIINDKISLQHDIHIVAFNGEEGNELGGTFGSRAMMGEIDCHDAAYMMAAQKYGYSEESLEAARLNTEKIKCYLELHIEQGLSLYSTGSQIGIVTGIAGLRRALVTVNGEGNHSGTTKMEYRKDALVGAAKIIEVIDRCAREFGNDMVATVSKLEVSPGALAIIPNKVEMVLEYRNLSLELMDQYYQTLQKRVVDLAEADWKLLTSKEPVICDPGIIQMITSACNKRKMKYQLMPSGATHDGSILAKKIPVGMIFVPSERGISHSKLEYTKDEDIVAGINILFDTIILLDQYS